MHYELTNTNVVGNANLRRYFNAQSWYRPWRNEVPSSAFNKYERANIAFLSKYD